MSIAMNTLRLYMTLDEMHIVLRGCTKREVDSLAWCVEQKLECERRPYLQQFVDISHRQMALLDLPPVTPARREMVHA